MIIGLIFLLIAWYLFGSIFKDFEAANFFAVIIGGMAIGGFIGEKFEIVDFAWFGLIVFLIGYVIKLNICINKIGEFKKNEYYIDSFKDIAYKDCIKINVYGIASIVLQCINIYIWSTVSYLDTEWHSFAFMLGCVSTVLFFVLIFNTFPNITRTKEALIEREVLKKQEYAIEQMTNVSKALESYYDSILNNFIKKHLWLKSDFIDINILEDIERQLKFLININLKDDALKDLLKYEENSVKFISDRSRNVYDSINILVDLLVEKNLDTLELEKQLIVFCVWKQLLYIIIMNSSGDVRELENRGLGLSLNKQDLIYKYLVNKDILSREQEVILFYKLIKLKLYKFEQLYSDYKNFEEIYKICAEKVCNNKLKESWRT